MSTCYQDFLSFFKKNLISFLCFKFQHCIYGSDLYSRLLTELFSQTFLVFILRVLRSAFQVFGWMSLDWDLSDFFFSQLNWSWVLRGEITNDTKMSFSSPLIMGTCYQHELSLVMFNLITWLVSLLSLTRLPLYIPWSLEGSHHA